MSLTIAEYYFFFSFVPSTPAAAAAAKLLQSCLTLCNPRDGSPPGSSVPGILQARTLKWVAISFSNAWKWKVKVKSLSLIRLFPTPWTVAYQAPPFIWFSSQEYWSGVPLPSPPSTPIYSLTRHSLSIYCGPDIVLGVREPVMNRAMILLLQVCWIF